MNARLLVGFLVQDICQLVRDVHRGDFRFAASDWSATRAFAFRLWLATEET